MAKPSCSGFGGGGAMLAAKTWYFCMSAAQVFMLPYITLFLQRDLNWEPWRVGLIQALRPWIQVPAAPLLCSLADYLGAHRSMLVICFTASVALRGAIAVAAPGAAAALLLLAEATGAPVNSIVDAEVVARCDGEYGKQRVWASLGWGGLSAVAGLLISNHGVRSGMLIYVILSVPALIAVGIMFWKGAHQTRAAAAAAAADAGGKDSEGRELADRKSSSGGLKAAVAAVVAEDNETAPRLGAFRARHAASGALALRTRLLTEAARMPSPGALASPLAGDEAAPAASPLRLPAPAPEGGSCCSTPRSTAALLEDEAALAVVPSAPPAPPAGWEVVEPGSPGANAVAVSLRVKGDAKGSAGGWLARGGTVSETGGKGLAKGEALALAAPEGGSGGGAAASGGCSKVLSLLAQPGVATFLLRALVMGFGIGVQGSFSFLLVSKMGGSELLMGLMLVASILTEAPAFQFQDALLSRISVSVVMQGSILLMALRLALYGLLPMGPTVWLVLPVELLHGVTFATAWGAGIVTCKRLAPPHLNTTMQSVFNTLWNGIGSGVGGIAAGVLMQRHGMVPMFYISAAVVVGGCMVAWLLDLVTGVPAALAEEDEGPAAGECAERLTAGGAETPEAAVVAEAK